MIIDRGDVNQDTSSSPNTSDHRRKNSRTPNIEEEYDVEEAENKYVEWDKLMQSDVPHWDGEFPKNLKYLWNHPDLSRTTKEKIAYHNSNKFFQ